MVVFDASTLILLAKVDVLTHVVKGRKVVVSKEVEMEATVNDEFFDAKMIKEFIRTQKIMVVPMEDQMLLKKFQKDFVFALGEASALVLACQYKAPLATDDRQAIKACKVLGVPFVTAIHFLIEVYLKKNISRALALAKLEQLKVWGRYNSQIMSDAIRRIGGEL